MGSSPRERSSRAIDAAKRPSASPGAFSTSPLSFSAIPSTHVALFIFALRACSWAAIAPMAALTAETALSRSASRTDTAILVRWPSTRTSPCTPRAANCFSTAVLTRSSSVSWERPWSLSLLKGTVNETMPFESAGVDLRPLSSADVIFSAF